MTALVVFLVVCSVVLVALRREWARLDRLNAIRVRAAARNRRDALTRQAEEAQAAAERAARERWAAMTPEERFAANLRAFRVETYYGLATLRSGHAFVTVNPA